MRLALSWRCSSGPARSPPREIIQELRRSCPDATLEVEEGAARTVGRNEYLVGAPDLMVPDPRHPAELDEPAQDVKLVTLAGGFAEDQVVADEVRQEACRLHPLARPAGAGGGPEDGVLEPLKDALRTGGATRAEFVASDNDDGRRRNVSLASSKPGTQASRKLLARSQQPLIRLSSRASILTE